MAARKKEENNMTIEEAFAAIDEKITALEDEDISLEESFAQYKQGMELLKYAHQAIESVEHKVKEIAEDGSLEDFE